MTRISKDPNGFYGDLSESHFYPIQGTQRTFARTNGIIAFGLIWQDYKTW